MANWSIKRTVDLDRGHGPVKYLDGVLAEVGDSQSHRWDVTVLKDYQPLALTGATITGYFTRADGQMVFVPGTVSGNVATVITDPLCMAIPGELICVMRVSLGGVTLSLDAFKIDVRGDLSDQAIDPGHVIPSLPELLAMLDEMAAATEAAEAAAESVAVYTYTDDGNGNITITAQGGNA